MDEKELDLLRELGRQRCLNQYYRTCYELYKELHQHISQALDNLLHLYQYAPESRLEGFSAVYGIADRIKTLVDSLKTKQDQAADEWSQLID